MKSQHVSVYSDLYFWAWLFFSRMSRRNVKQSILCVKWSKHFSLKAQSHFSFDCNNFFIVCTFSAKHLNWNNTDLCKFIEKNWFSHMMTWERENFWTHFISQSISRHALHTFFSQSYTRANRFHHFSLFTLLVNIDQISKETDRLGLEIFVVGG